MMLRELGKRIKRDVEAIVALERRYTADPVDVLPGDGLQGMPTVATGRPTRADAAAPVESPLAAPHVPKGMPAPGRITDAFGMRLHPIEKKWKPHKGEDIAAPRGTPVRATADGEVVYAGALGTFGKLVEIAHDGDYRTRYAHLDSVTVRVGQAVVRGEVVGAVGSTGRATGPHLHYEVLVKGEQVDPRRFL